MWQTTVWGKVRMGSRMCNLLMPRGSESKAMSLAMALEALNRTLIRYASAPAMEGIWAEVQIAVVEIAPTSSSPDDSELDLEPPENLATLSLPDAAPISGNSSQEQPTKMAHSESCPKSLFDESTGRMKRASEITPRGRKSR